MLVRFISKTGLLSSASGAAWLSLIADVPETPANNTKKFEASQESLPKTIGSFDDIEIFEKLRGCKFVFSDNKQTVKKYTAKEIFEKISKERKGLGKAWERDIIYNADFYKRICSKGKVVNFVEKWENKLSYNAGL